MFEQESYKQEVPQVKPQRGDLFYNYEIRNWNFSPRIYKILLVSALANVLGIAVIAQTNLLTMRGCASPFVGRVCEVLDAAYVTSVLFGTERDVVDAAYDKIDLGEADITYIDVSGAEPPFDYPTGYFQVANPEQYASIESTDPFGPGSGFSIPPSTGGNLASTPPVIPPANPNAVTGNIPDSPFAVVEEAPPASSNARKGRRGGRPVPANTKPAEDAVANNETQNANTNTNNSSADMRTDKITGDQINLRPLKDLSVFVNENLEKGVDLQSDFVLAAQGRLNKDGRLDPKSFRYLKAESPNKQLLEIVQQAIEALNESGRLKVLQDLTGKDLNLLVQQDNANITAVVQSQVESEARARSLQSGLNVLLSAAKQFNSGPDASQNDKDVLLLLERAQIEANGKELIIRFTIPKDLAHPMIQRKLAEQKQQQTKPNGNAAVRNVGNTAKK